MTKPGPTLTDARGMGGIIAQDGFDYQTWDAAIRIASWLRIPVFEGVTAEGIEDLEARFFAPTSPHGHVLDRFQAKSGQLTRAQVEQVFQSFLAFERAHPAVARAQVLVTPMLPKDLQWLARDVERVRRARPFYAPFPDVVDASNKELQKSLVDEFGTELGAFLSTSAEVDLRHFPDRQAARAQFAAALESTFPDLDLRPSRVDEAFGLVARRLNEDRGRMVTRDTLLALVCDALGASHTPTDCLAVHVRSDRNAPAVDAVEIDASRFSNKDGPPPSERDWQEYLLTPLERTARWAQARGFGRLRLSGSYRLSTAFMLGWAFRSASGFELDIATRDGDWKTDERPTSDAKLRWDISPPEELLNGRMVVAVGVLRDPVSDIDATLGTDSVRSILRAQLNQPVTSSMEAQFLAQEIKSAVAAASTRLRPDGIDLFYAGPAVLAVTIGHRWNAMPSTRLYEHRGDGAYHKSGLLA